VGDKGGIESLPRRKKDGSLVKDGYGFPITDLWTTEAMYGLKVLVDRYNEAMNEGERTDWGRKATMRPTPLGDGRFILASSAGRLRLVSEPEVKSRTAQVQDQLAEIHAKMQAGGIQMPTPTDDSYFESFCGQNDEKQMELIRTGDADHILADIVKTQRVSDAVKSEVTKRVEAKVEELRGITRVEADPAPAPLTKEEAEASPRGSLVDEQLGDRPEENEAQPAVEKVPVGAGAGTVGRVDPGNLAGLGEEASS
jgi:hypothetical protein